MPDSRRPPTSSASEGVNINDFSAGITSVFIGGTGSRLALQLPGRRILGQPAVGSVGADDRGLDGVSPRAAGNHTVKWGGNVRHNRDFLLQVQDRLGPRGGFEFNGQQTAIPTDNAALNGFANSFASFLLDVPSRVGRDLTVVDPGTRHWAVFSFIHDKWQVTPKITIDLGLRHEYYTPLVGLARQGRARQLRSGDQFDPRRRATVINPANLGVKKYLKNFAPRTGHLLSHDGDVGRPRRLRHQHDSVPRQQLRVQLPGEAEQRLQRAEHVRAGAGADGGRISGARFSPTFPSNGIIPATYAAPAESALLRDSDRPARGAAAVVERGVSAPTARRLHRRSRLRRQSRKRGQHHQSRTPEWWSAPTTRAGRSSDRSDAPPKRPAWMRSNTTYHSLQTKFDKRLSQGLLVTTSYTLGRSINYWQGDTNGGIVTPADPERSRGRAEYDRLHSYVQSFVYQLPVGPDGRWLQSGPASWILGGWQVSGIFTAQSGQPISFTANAATLRAPGNTQRPNVSGKPDVARRHRREQSVVRSVGVFVPGPEHLRQREAERHSSTGPRMSTSTRASRSGSYSRVMSGPSSESTRSMPPTGRSSSVRTASWGTRASVRSRRRRRARSGSCDSGCVWCSKHKGRAKTTRAALSYL